MAALKGILDSVYWNEFILAYESTSNETDSDTIKGYTDRLSNEEGNGLSIYTYLTMYVIRF